MLRNGLQGDLILVARARLLSRQRRHIEVLRASSKIGIWEMVPPSARKHPARFTRRPVSRDSRSTCVSPNIISTQQAGIEFRAGIIQNLDMGIARHALRARPQTRRLPTPNQQPPNPPVLTPVEYPY